MTFRGISAAIGILGLAAWSLPPASVQEEPSFAAKTVTMTIGFGTGGSVDLYGRTLGRYLINHLPGHPSLVVINQHPNRDESSGC